MIYTHFVYEMYTFPKIYVTHMKMIYDKFIHKYLASERKQWVATIFKALYFDPENNTICDAYWYQRM